MGEQAQRLEDHVEEELLMAVVIPINWVTPHRNHAAPLLPATTQLKAVGAAGAVKVAARPARLPNPEREVVTGAKLHDVLRW